MNKKEKELFLQLCNFEDVDENKLKQLLTQYATPHVLGHLFFNRMQGVAYGVLKESNMLNLVNREFRNSLHTAYEYNLLKNRDYNRFVDMVYEALLPCKGKYAMLKGAYLCQEYPIGYRTSNDIDILTRADDVSEIGSLLSAKGFKQGKIVNGIFVAATRREIIESKMMRGETVPYILETNSPYIKYLEVDINFSLDYKNGDRKVLDKMISNAVEYDSGKARIVTLERYDFFLHLCGHLYKEASTYPWVKMKRDMTLYKYCDIYRAIRGFSQQDVEMLLKRAKEVGMAEICACVVIWTSQLFNIGNTHMVDIFKKVLAGKEEILDIVISPAENKKYIFTDKNIRNRFFAEDRCAMLREV